MVDPAAVAATAPQPVSSADELQTCFVLHGRVTIGSTALRCAGCGGTDGPWLAVSTKRAAFVTCRCGTRSAHPRITRQVVESYATEPLASWPSVAAAERALLEGS